MKLQPPRANYCGSTEPTHRAYRCRECQKIRQQRRRIAFREKHPLPLGPSCALCGIVQRNKYGIKVYRYSLLRSIRTTRLARGWTNKSVGSLPVCDRCLIEGGYVRRELVA